MCHFSRSKPEKLQVGALNQISLLYYTTNVPVLPYLLSAASLISYIKLSAGTSLLQSNCLSQPPIEHPAPTPTLTLTSSQTTKTKAILQTWILQYLTPCRCSQILHLTVNHSPFLLGSRLTSGNLPKWPRQAAEATVRKLCPEGGRRLLTHPRDTVPL
jgi:hypothetical protein